MPQVRATSSLNYRRRSICPPDKVSAIPLEAIEVMKTSQVLLRKRGRHRGALGTRGCPSVEMRRQRQAGLDSHGQYGGPTIPLRGESAEYGMSVPQLGSDRGTRHLSGLRLRSASSTEWSSLMVVGPGDPHHTAADTPHGFGKLDRRLPQSIRLSERT